MNELEEQRETEEIVEDILKKDEELEEIEVTAYDRSNYIKSWNKQFEEVIKSDEITKPERVLFKDDTELDKLIIKKKILDKKIIAHIEKVIRTHRNQEAVKLAQTKPIEPVKFKPEFE
jgi:hypothetical protein